MALPRPDDIVFIRGEKYNIRWVSEVNVGIEILNRNTVHVVKIRLEKLQSTEETPGVFQVQPNFEEEVLAEIQTVKGGERPNSRG